MEITSSKSIEPTWWAGVDMEPLKEYSGSPMYILYDADILAYRCAAATDGVYYTVGTEQFKYHKDAKLYVDASHVLHDPPLYSDIEKHYDPEPVENAISNLDGLIRKINRDCTEKHKRPMVGLFYLTHDILFRSEISKTYKCSRVAMRKPVHLDALKKHLRDNYDAITWEGFEADDLISISAREKGLDNCIVASVDKDLLQIPGWHYNIASGKSHYQSCHGAKLSFWSQTIIGDKVDDIEGLKGVGPVGARDVLKDTDDFSTHRDFYNLVLAKYISHNKMAKGETVEEHLIRNIRQLGKACRLLWLARDTVNPIWDVPK